MSSPEREEIMNKQIDVGDVVMVNNNAIGMNVISKAVVIFKPDAEGAMWGFEDQKDGSIIYTNERITIYKRPQP